MITQKTSHCQPLDVDQWRELTVMVYDYAAALKAGRGCAWAATHTRSVMMEVYRLGRSVADSNLSGSDLDHAGVVTFADMLEVQDVVDAL